MKNYPDGSLYVLGTAKIGKNDPISDQYNTFFIGLVVAKETGEILDLTSNMVQQMTTDFIRSITTGYRLGEEIDQIVEAVNTRFFGMAQKTVIAALKDARNKYLMILEQNKM